MIIVDRAVGSKELRSPILRNRVGCEIDHLKWGDAAFEGNGPNGTMLIGVERKKLHDMLACILDGRYNSQRVGMKQMYGQSHLIIEALWKEREDGILLEGFRDYKAERSLPGRTVISWTPAKFKSQSVMFSTLYRYLVSVAHAGVIITSSSSLEQTAFIICELYHYYQKKWNNHTSLLDHHRMAIPALTKKPSLVRLWAANIEGVGVKHLDEATALFRKPVRLANSDEQDWIRVGFGARTAQDIVRQIQGWDRRG